LVTETAAVNDVYDIFQLMHVGDEAFFVTHDRKLLERVDRSGSFQSPWVRTLAEVWNEDLPTGRPWGANARKFAASFRRSPLAQVLDESDRLLSELRIRED
jgi:hypothetical protein